MQSPQSKREEGGEGKGEERECGGYSFKKLGGKGKQECRAKARSHGRILRRFC